MISPIGSKNWDILDSQSGHALTKSEQKIHFAVMETMVSWMGKMQHNMQLSFNEEFEKAVDGMRQELLGHVEERMEVQDESLTYHSTSVDANEQEIEELRERCLVLEGRLTKAENEVDELKEKLLAQEARSMRDNLTFFNIPEKDGEDCEKSLRKFLRREMSISREDMEKIVFNRVHRTGCARPGFNRIVVAKFSSYEGRQIVLSHIKHLDREKKYGVNEQLPREIAERKNQLMPIYKAARRDRKNAKWSREKLIIDGKTKEVMKDKIRDVNVNCTDKALGLRRRYVTVHLSRRRTARSRVTASPSLHKMISYLPCMLFTLM